MGSARLHAGWLALLLLGCGRNSLPSGRSALPAPADKPSYTVQSITDSKNLSDGAAKGQASDRTAPQSVPDGPAKGQASELSLSFGPHGRELHQVIRHLLKTAIPPLDAGSHDPALAAVYRALELKGQGQGGPPARIDGPLHWLKIDSSGSITVSPGLPGSING